MKECGLHQRKFGCEEEGAATGVLMVACGKLVAGPSVEGKVTL